MPIFDFECDTCSRSEQDCFYMDSEEADSNPPSCAQCCTAMRRTISAPNVSQFIFSRCDDLGKAIGKKGPATAKDLYRFEEKHGGEIGLASDKRYKQQVERVEAIEAQAKALRAQGAPSSDIRRVYETEGGTAPDTKLYDEIMSPDARDRATTLKNLQGSHGAAASISPAVEGELRSLVANPGALDAIVREAVADAGSG